MNHYPAISNRLLKFFWENEVSRLLLTYSIDVLNKHFSVSDISDTAERFRTAYHIGGICNDLLLWFSQGMTETAEEMVRYTMKFQIPSDVSLFRQ